MYAVFGDGQSRTFDTKDAAIEWGRGLPGDSYEVYDADDRLVHQERPESAWA